MKNKFMALLLCFLLAVTLSGCSNKATTYQETIAQSKVPDIKTGYFTTIAKWKESDSKYYIVYANDTKVKYLKIYSYDNFIIIPLYNTDGTLQIYEGK